VSKVISTGFGVPLQKIKPFQKAYLATQSIAFISLKATPLLEKRGKLSGMNTLIKQPLIQEQVSL